jgi:hypothetical protein
MSGQEFDIWYARVVAHYTGKAPEHTDESSNRWSGWWFVVRWWFAGAAFLTMVTL